LDPGPHYSENPGALKAHSKALECLQQIRTVVKVSHHFDDEADPYLSERFDPDPHQLDADPHC